MKWVIVRYLNFSLMKNKHSQKKVKDNVNLLVRMPQIKLIEKLNKKVLHIHQFLVSLHLRVYLNHHKIKKEHSRNVKTKIIKVKNQWDLEIVLNRKIK